MDNLIEKDLKYIWHPCSQMKDYETLKPILVEKGCGVELFSADGKKYLDLVSSWWCNLLGHCNERINNAVKKQIDELEHVIFANFTHKKAIELCEKLIKFLPKGLEKFFFCDNGSSAIEAGLKMSFQYHAQTGNPQKTRFMALTDAYHGETIGALSVCGTDLYSEIYKPVLLDVIRIQGPDCFRCPFGLDCKTCEAQCIKFAQEKFEEFGRETCAIIIEPLLQGAAGMKIYSPIYLKKLRELCDKYNVHLIADEIATGYMRTGKMFACDWAKITPDIMCLSKGLTGGYMPMALTITTKKIFDAFWADYTEGKAFMHSHTYSGNPLACAAACEVLNIFEEGKVLEDLEEKAKYFNYEICKKFQEHKNVGEIRSIGLINAIELVEDKKTKKEFDWKMRIGYKIYQHALEYGLLLRPLGNVIYFNPPLVIKKEQMDYAIKMAYQAMAEVLGE